MAEKIDIDSLFESADLAAVRFTYDRDSDTLMVHLKERGIPAVSLSQAPGVYIRWDPVGEQVTAIQLENFIRGTVLRQPSLLDYADVYGISADDIEAGSPPSTRRIWSRLHRPRHSVPIPDSPQSRRSALGTLQPLFGLGENLLGILHDRR